MKAKIKIPFTVVQWHGEDYPNYEEDAIDNTFSIGDEVEVLKEATSNPMGRQFVIYSERTNEATVVNETYLEFIE